MKILFVYKYEFIEPIGLMYLSSFLKKNRHDCYFIDVKFEKDVCKEVRKISPDIIAYSITTGKHKFYQELNQKLKKKFKFFSVFGGPHCTFFPEFIHEKGVDVVCRGEGEFPLLELVNNLEKKRDITKIKNLWLKIDGKLYKNEVRELIRDLDVLPFPDRELVNKYNHYKKMHRRSVSTGRGCPYSCTYCFNHSYNKLYKNKGIMVRRRSIENVIEELKFINKKYKPKRFNFIDDTFIINHNWVFEFCKVYKKEINMPFVVNVRVNLIDDKIVKALKYAGCVMVMYAIESGNDNIRNGILKKNISIEQMINAGNLFDKYGIKTIVQNMVGLPDETLNMAFETMMLNIKIKASYSWVSIFQPYPKTELCEYSKQKGYFDSNMDVFDESFFNTSVMKMKDIKKMERLRHLFSWGVSFPISIPLIKLLIKLPLNNFYQILWLFHKAWYYSFKVKGIDLSEFFIKE